MSLRSTFSFVLQSASAGLAVAFLVLLWRGSTTATAPSSGAAPAGVGGYAAAVAAAAPAVVNIYTRKLVDQRANPLLRDPMYRRFFGPALTEPQRRAETSLGSGVILTRDGHAITNFHVVESADEIAVLLRDGRSVVAELAGADPDTDLAVLKLLGDDFPAVTIADSDRVVVGDVVLAIGNPFGVGQTVSQGIVSATGRNRIGLNTYENFIQTDAAVNPGNSGGALVNTRGELVGVNAAIVTHTGGAIGISFAIPSNTAVAVLNDLRTGGVVVRGWIGIEVRNVDAEQAEFLGLGSGGVVVERVLEGGPADSAGIVLGDIITHIAGQPVYDSRGARDLIAAVGPGQAVEVNIRRGIETFNATVVAAQRPRAEINP